MSITTSSRSRFIDKLNLIVLPLILVAYFSARLASPGEFFHGFAFSERFPLLGPAVGTCVWAAFAALTFKGSAEKENPIAFIATLLYALFSLVCLRLLVLQMTGL